MQFVVKSAEDLMRAIFGLHKLGFPFTITAKAGEPQRKRTDEMNRTIHMWFGEIAKQSRHMTSEEVKADCNLTYGVPILRRDDNEWGSAFGYIFDTLNRPSQIKALRVLNIPVTRNMRVKQLKEYMDQMQRDYREAGFRLTDPDARKYEQEFAA